MPNVYNDAMLEALFLIELKGIINEVAKSMLKELQQQIQSEVYDAGDPIRYHRLGLVGGLLGSFEKYDATIMGREVQSTIDQNPMSMVNDPDDHVHGSNEWIMTDIRDLLSEIIIEGKSGKRFGDGFWREPRDFWTPFIQLIDNGICDKYIQLEAKKRGITLIKV
jgi:hypothetical protein